MQQVIFPPSFSLENIYTAILSFFLQLNSSALAGQFHPIVYAVKFVGTFLSLVFFIGIIFVSVKMKEFYEKQAAVEAEEFARAEGPLPKSQPAQTLQRSEAGARKWQRVLDHVASANPNDWRLAILEADVLLEELLDSMNAAGETLGEKLKSMTTTEMPSLQLAWEGHKVRNQIAHEGADFVLSQHEARRIIGLYERVLRQGLYI